MLLFFGIYPGFSLHVSRPSSFLPALLLQPLLPFDPEVSSYSSRPHQQFRTPTHIQTSFAPAPVPPEDLLHRIQPREGRRLRASEGHGKRSKEGSQVDSSRESESKRSSKTSETRKKGKKGCRRGSLVASKRGGREGGGRCWSLSSQNKSNAS